ncbi:MAG: hypothetical protein ACM31C_21300 [Acidobacteriota bacterium]
MKHSLCTVLLLALAGHAAADNKSEADRLFKSGKKLMAEKKYAEACQAFEQSFKLDPGIGAELNTARCYEDWGKLARAYTAYQQADEMAREAKDPREPKIHELVVGIEPKVPRLTLKVPAGADTKSLTVTIDDKPLDASALGQPQMVDPGPHTIAYEVNGKKKKKLVPVDRGGSSEITLEVPKAVDKGVDVKVDRHKEEPVRVVTTPDPGRTQKLLAYGAGGLGVVLVGVSSYMTLSARSQFNDALSQHCMNMTNMCDATGLTQTHDARHEANVATVVFLVGAAAVGGGVALYLTAPKAARRSDEHALYLVPSVTPSAAGIVLGGRM